MKQNKPDFNLTNLLQHIVQLNEISQKVKGILQNVFHLQNFKYFYFKIQNSTLPALSTRVQLLSQLILSSYRLPFSAEKIREDFFFNAQKTLASEHLSDVDPIEREYFQLLGEYFTHSEFSKKFP